jgi:hypothetical protein
MRVRLVSLFCLAAVLAAVNPTLASTTGAIVGTVKDESGAALPGVTVSVKGDAIVGTLTSVANSEGFYRFAVLPPGVYTLTYSMPGFATENRQGIKVSLGETLAENASLKVSQRSEEVTVTGEAPVVDTESNTVGTHYDKDWVRNAPIPRFTFFDFLNSAPGVNQTGQGLSRSTSLGSSTSDNAYMLDGTDFTAPYTGAAWPWPNTDAVEEIEVLSLGAPAEYGSLQGAVFNVVTRQGSNTFHGDANFYFQHQDLTFRNTTDKQDGGKPYNRDKYNDATFQLSGPVVKDKLWFFGSYQYQRDYDSQAGVDPNFPAKFEADRVFFKANYQVSPQHKLMFAYHDDYYRIPIARGSALNAPSSLKVESGHNPAPNLTYTGILSDKTYFEARVSGFYGKDHGDPLEPSEPRVKTRFNDLDSGQITGGIYSWYDGDSWKTGASAKLSHFSDNFMGASHDFKFGVQYNEGGHDYTYGLNDYIYTYSGVPAYGYTQLPFHLGGKEKTIGAYADDTLRAGSRLTLNLGLRFDNSKAQYEAYPILDRLGNPTGQSTAPNDKLFTWNSVSPRIGFNYKLTGDGKTVLKAHYGRYYRGIITQEFDDAAPSVTPRFSFSGTYDAAGNPEGTSLSSDNSNLRIDPNFKNPYTDQFIAGFDRQLYKDLGLEINYVYKRGENPGGWLDIGGEYVPATYSDTTGAEPSGQDITVQRLVNSRSDRLFLLTNPNIAPARMFSRFNGVTVQLTKRMSHNWQMVTSVVVSKATGRIGSSDRSPTQRQEGYARSFGQNPNDFINTDELLVEDHPLVVKTQFVYQLPKGFLLGLNLRQQSGRPWARQVRVSGVTGFSTTILAEPLDGHRRVEDQTILDLRAQKEFGLGGRANIALLVDALNLLNDGANEGIGSRRADSSSFGLPTVFIAPRRIMLGAKLRF